MKTITINTADLSGAALDWAVAKVEGVNAIMFRARKEEQRRPLALFGSLALSIGGDNPEYSYSPSSCWHCGGPLIESYWREATAWLISIFGPSWRDEVDGTTGELLTWFCRAIVAAKLGDTVEVPDDLVGTEA